MAWKDGFQIEYIPYELRQGTKPRKHLNCRDCQHYESEDRSCSKTACCFQEDSLDSWKYCKFFHPYENTINTPEKEKEYSEWLKKHPNAKKEKTVADNKTVLAKGKQKKTEEKNYISNEEIKKLSLILVDAKKEIPLPRKRRYIKLYLDTGEKADIFLFEVDGKVYLKKGRVSHQWEEEAIRVFKKR